MSRIDVLGLDA